MVSRYARIQNVTGLHLKPAARLTQEAVRFNSTITITHGSVTANVKSILSLLGACVKTGETIEIVCNGDDETAAIEAICRVIEEGLGDDIE